MEVQFNVGDVVELNSGSPDMTVTFVREDGDLLCRWFTAPPGTPPLKDVFPPQALRRKPSR